MSLLSPLFLLGLLAIGLPWLLHRFSHHEPPEHAFPSKRFLKASKPPVSHKKKIRYRALFMLRALLLAALCFLFAQPWIKQSSDQVLGDTTQLLVIDNSFSMRAEFRWEQAVEKMSTLIDALPEGANAQLFSSANTLSALTELSSNHDELKRALNDVAPGFHSLDFGELMARLNNLAAKNEQATFTQLVSDVQQSAKPLQTNELFAAKLAGFNVTAVGDSAIDNAWITAEARSDDNLFARINVQLSASNSLNQSATVQKTVQVLLDEEVVSAKDITLATGESVTLNFDKLELPSTENPVFQVRIVEEDALLEDNNQLVPVRGLKPIEVFYVSENQNKAMQSEVFIRTALETNRLAMLTRAPEASALIPTQAQHVVVRAKLNSDGELPKWVSDAAEQGTNILFIPLRDSTSPTQLSGRPMHFSQVDLAHPIALSGLNLFDMRFYESFDYAANYVTGPQYTVLLMLDNGTPILAEFKTESGAKVLLLNDPLDGLYSDMPQHPEFVVLMQKLIQYFESSNTLAQQATVGKSLRLPANVQLLTPAEKPMLTLEQSSSESVVQLKTPGLYTVLGTQGESVLLARTDPRESNVLVMNQESISSWERRHIDVSDVEVNAVDEPAAVPENTNESSVSKKWMWQWLLPLLALVFFIEPLLANRALKVSRDGA